MSTTTTKTEPTADATLLDPPATANLPAVPEHTNVLDVIGTIESEWDGLDDLDMSPDAAGIPVIKIGRKADGSGGIRLAGDEDDTMEVEFVWAARGLSRVLFDGPFDEGQRLAAGLGADVKVVCRSADGASPLPNQPVWTDTDLTIGPAVLRAPTAPATCGACPNLYENGGTCKKSMEALVYLPEGDEMAVRVARLRFGGLAYKAARQYWDSFKFRLPKIPCVAFKTTMTLVREKTDNGYFLVPSFARTAQLTRQQAEVFIIDARSRAAQWRAVIAEDLMETTAAAADDISTGPGPFDPPAPDGGTSGTAAGVVYDENSEPF